MYGEILWIYTFISLVLTEWLRFFKKLVIDIFNASEIIFKSFLKSASDALLLLRTKLVNVDKYVSLVKLFKLTHS